MTCEPCPVDRAADRSIEQLQRIVILLLGAGHDGFLDSGGGRSEATADPMHKYAEEPR